MNINIYKFIRIEDVSGVSGTGHVANIIEFDDKVIMKWKTNPSSIGVYDSLDDLLKIHDHEGNSELEKVELYDI